MRRKIYVAGPMRGRPNYNFPCFDYAAKKLREQGWIVINPAEMDRLFEGWEMYPPDEFEQPFTKADFKRFITRDLMAIGDCDALYMLTGWEDSKGAKAEHALAEFLGLEIIYE